MDPVKIKANYYQEFDADYSLDVPAEGYGGWKKGEIEIAPDHTALVVMHAWDCGTLEEYPGWWRCVEYIPRSHEICRTVMPPLLAAVRQSGMPLFHVVGGKYYQDMPGYKRTVELAGPEPPRPEYIQGDPVRNALREFRAKHVHVGEHNRPDVDRGGAAMTFPKEVWPLDSEGIAENAHQLFALCKQHNVNHLIYTGFAINWCLLMSPGGMLDMSRRGVMCSVIKEATTACENKESARGELHKREALWRVSVAFGFVFDLEDILQALRSQSWGKPEC
jgi:nicotinamidase-related amidase